jgi:tRNA A37 threonylcarbamoyltransferase TsaD
MGCKIDGNTFTLLNNTSDITFGEVSDFMKANLDLSPNQLVFIDEEMKEKQTPNEQ